jgi:hypothetical protein
VPEGASIAGIAPAAARRRGLGGGGSFSAGVLPVCVERCRALQPEPKF